MITKGFLHYTILKHIIDKGFAPSVDSLSEILKTDVSIAKNYLSEKEIKELERIVVMYLDYAELQAQRQIPMKMTDWVSRLDAFLQFNEYKILQDAGSISHEIAKTLAEKAYEHFRLQQDKNFESDFEKQIKRLKKES